MHKYTKKEFTRLSLEQRYLVLKKQGEYIAARQVGDHRIYLYSVSNFYVEMWILFCINEIRWIEIQKNKAIVNEYADSVKLNDLTN